MSTSEIHAVTGAFGYSGRFIARRLLQVGKTVRTLTNSADQTGEFQGRIETHPFSFDNQERLTESLRGVNVLYNTYWVRFNHRTFKHGVAVDNTRKLFEAAKRAGVRRIIHTSITKPSANAMHPNWPGEKRDYSWTEKPENCNHEVIQSCDGASDFYLRGYLEIRP